MQPVLVVAAEAVIEPRITGGLLQIRNQFIRVTSYRMRERGELRPFNILKNLEAGRSLAAHALDASLFRLSGPATIMEVCAFL
jgi:hypothetical protein